MSSWTLRLIVLGQALFFGTASLDLKIIVTTVDENLTPGQKSTQPEIRRDDYTYIPDIGAYKVHTQAAIWNDAKLICEKEGGHLAIINSDAESTEMKNLFLASRPYQTGSFHSHYAIIGFRKRLDKCDYLTVFGKPLEGTGFYRWGANEPNNLNGEEHCGSMDDSGLLNDINCENKYSFICELPDWIGAGL